MSTRGKTKVTTNHEEIQTWVEKRDGRPAKAQGTDILRIDFPGYTGEGTLEPVSWEDFFRIFDENNLAFVHQDRTAGGRISRFNKLVDRESVADELKGAA